MSKSKTKKLSKSGKASKKTASASPNPQEITRMTALFNEGRVTELEALFKTWTLRFPKYVPGWQALRSILTQQGRNAEALEPIQKIAELLPEDAEAQFHLGNIQQELGQAVDAVATYRRTLEIKPDFAEVHNNLGNALQALGQLDDAVTCYRQALRVKPDNADTLNNLGHTLQALGHLDDAIICYHRALELKPDFAEAYNNLGNALQDHGRLDDAAACYRRALELKQDYADAYSNLGNTLLKLGQPDDAMSSYQRALALNPDLSDVHNNIGNILQDRGQLEEAMACYRRALEIEPDFAEAHSNQGSIFFGQGSLLESEVSFRRALEIKPDFAETYSNLLFFLTHNEKTDAKMLAVEHRRFGEQFEAPLIALWSQHSNSRAPARCLQIGFVSGDLRAHAVASFIEPVLEHLEDYPQLALHAYYNHNVEDSVTLRLRKYFKHWHPVVGLSDDALAEKIRTDGIDILIDLSGHTAKNRLLAFARKPAPVQVSWMGYPGTTGLSGMDYYMADRFLLPPGQFDDQFTEKIVRLPACAPYQPDMSAPPVNALPALGNGYATFGSFNRQSKLSPSVIGLWSQLLRALPGSRMVLGGISEEGKYGALVDWFAKEGIARERLSFHARCGIADYLRLHQQVDMCLDTFPYNGATTTLNALWMGVPTLTLVGRTVTARQGSTLLSQVGLDAFVAQDAADFVRKGLSWAGDPASLANVRAHLRERLKQSEIGQPAVVAKSLEYALRIMWQRWCDGLPAESFEVSRQDNVRDK
ncbi:tetratricopeptide repeat protein [Methylobacter sp.]|uniref:tetratricopeptide repeat protein n=1 Tax=Methylobacter sp. TaxID=2051955 RepID=UPI002FDEDD17